MFKWVARRVSKRKPESFGQLLRRNGEDDHAIAVWRMRTFSTCEEVEQLLGLPVLATYDEPKDR